MMNDRASAVERLIPYMTPAQKSLAVARDAVSRNDKNAKALLDKVDPAYRKNPIYYFSRAERARQFELWDDAIAYLNKGQKNDPDAALWWYERQTLIRQLLSAGDAKRAYRAAADYTSGPEGRLVEARFHAGWIALSFLNDPKSAVKHFEAMAKLSSLADSVTQANYWLGRAKAAAGDPKGAKAAYEIAAGYGTIYYGLLARDALGLKPVELRAMPAWQDDEATFDGRQVVQAINLLVADGKNDMAGVLLRNLAQSQLKSGGELVLAARLAQKIDAHHLAITIADIADKRGVPLDLFSFPKDGLPTTKLADIDMAAIYAITRTESRFQVDAVSSSGAKGLMQLMPATAKETAKKIGVSYSASKLTSDPAYNAQLGSSYLAAQLSNYNGSLLLAAAAYNAGAGNANKWIAAYGDPRAKNVDPVVWVELIPFQETRKYVQRVLGNYLVYRARLGGTEISPAAALHSIAG
jgi:soluble lytic murein transglycosylase